MYGSTPRGWTSPDEDFTPETGSVKGQPLSSRDVALYETFVYFSQRKCWNKDFSGRFPFVRPDRNENFTVNQNYPTTSVKS